MNEYPKERYTLCSSSECKNCDFHIITQRTKTSYCLLVKKSEDLKKEITKKNKEDYEKQKNKT